MAEIRKVWARGDDVIATEGRPFNQPEWQRALLLPVNPDGSVQVVCTEIDRLIAEEEG